jgi:hypothetical protein
VSGADQYCVYRQYFSDSGTWSSWNKVATVSSTTFSDLSAVTAQYCRYQVTSLRGKAESNKSVSKSGYRKGARFSNVTYYDPSNGIGFEYDLRCYGYKGQTKALAIYCVYLKDGVYRYVPGSGFNNSAAYVTTLYMSYELSERHDARIWLYDSAWHKDWRNNGYPQYINLRLYQSASISSLNSPWLAQVGYHPITWRPNAVGEMIPLLGPKLTDEEVKKLGLDRQEFGDTDCPIGTLPLGEVGGATAAPGTDGTPDHHNE